MATVDLDGNRLVIVCGGYRRTTDVTIDPNRPENIDAAVREALSSGVAFFYGISDAAGREVERMNVASAIEQIRHKVESAQQAQREPAPAARRTIAGTTPRLAPAHVELNGNEIVVVCRGRRRATGVSIDPTRSGSIEATVREAIQAAVPFFMVTMGDQESREVQAINPRAATDDILVRLSPASVEREGAELVVSCGGMRHRTGIPINPNDPEHFEAAVRRAIRAAGPFFRSVGRAYAREVEAIDPAAAAARIKQGLTIAQPQTPAQEEQPQRRRPVRHR